MKQTLQLKVSNQLTLTPQLQQSIKLLQMSTVELNEEIERMLQENPMLDTEEMAEGLPPDLATAPERPNDRIAIEDTVQEMPDDHAFSDWMNNVSFSSGGSPDDDDRDDDASAFTVVPLSLSDHLHHQLGLMPISLRDRELIAVLIDSLNDDGYLTQPLEELLETVFADYDVTLDELRVALQLLQHFDPAGIAARTPSECLAIQLAALEEHDTVIATARSIVDHHLPLLASRDYTRLKKLLKCDATTLKKAIDLIVSLNPRPGARFSAIAPRYVIPDVVVRKHRQQWIVSLNEEAIPKLKINRLYATLLQASTDTKSEALSGQLQEARWFIRNIRQRFETILRVTQAIIQRQSDFLEHGEVSMRPLVLKEIAEQLDLHESTISRVTNQKYIQTPRGIYELKYFFGSHVNTESGGHCSSTAIRALIRQLVAQEDAKHPLSDSKIAQLLNDQGIVVARRTVAKYRELMQIPPVNQRKTI